ncbi:MAG: hypothetical protein VKJ24_15670 [Synechococcales bacterium]|nr:hypothetical protein [Synechococcales bacterium]
MRNSKAAGQPLARPQSYSPSVPISLYREVTAELQTTKAALEACQTQNQQLLQQNQQLRQEMQRIAQLAMHTHQNLEQSTLEQSTNGHRVHSVAMSNRQQPAWEKGRSRMGSKPRPGMKSAIAQTPSSPTSMSAPSSLPAGIGALPQFSPQAPEMQQWQMIEGADLQEQRSSGASLDLSGWKLGVVLALIVVTAFGAGFMIVRPMLNSR